jgi:hypothetical protein
MRVGLLKLFEPECIPGYTVSQKNRSIEPFYYTERDLRIGSGLRESSRGSIDRKSVNIRNMNRLAIDRTA